MKGIREDPGIEAKNQGSEPGKLAIFPGPAAKRRPPEKTMKGRAGTRPKNQGSGTGIQPRSGEAKKTMKGEAGILPKTQGRTAGKKRLKKTKGAGGRKNGRDRKKPSKAGREKRGRKRPGNVNGGGAKKTIEAGENSDGPRNGKKDRTRALKNAGSPVEAVYFGGRTGEGGGESGGRKRPTPMAA